jgi:hypothetical protein
MSTTCTKSRTALPSPLTVTTGSTPAATAATRGMIRVGSSSARPSTAPAALNSRIVTAPSAPVAAWAPISCSAAAFEEPYGFSGAMAAVSLIGCCAGLPYTEPVDANTSRAGVGSASSRFSVPATLVRHAWVGCVTESRTVLRAARCTTLSMSAAISRSESCRSPRLVSTSSGNVAGDRCTSATTR